MKIYSTSDTYDLNKYIGKDVWVLAKVPEGRSYIKILSVISDVVTYREVYDEYVDGDWGIEPDDPELWLYSPYDVYKHHEPVDKIHIITPISIFTTDELYEILCSHIGLEDEE